MKEHGVMMDEAVELSGSLGRSIRFRTKGHVHGPVTRLFSPGDLGDEIKPFVFLDRIDMEASAEALFGWHPHSGIATVTTVVQGDTAYADSTGAEGVLKAGGVEFMQAGGGVWHTANPADQGRVRGYQLWLALPATLENGDAMSEYLAPQNVPTIGTVRVILGTYGGATSPLPRISPLNYLHVTMRAGETWTYEPAAEHDIAFVAVTDGVLEIAGMSLSSEVAVFEDGNGPLFFRAHGDVDFMLGSAAKHPHPLVMGHYSVHTGRQALAVGEDGIKTLGEKLRLEGRI